MTESRSTEAALPIKPLLAALIAAPAGDRRDRARELVDAIWRYPEAKRREYVVWLAVKLVHHGGTSG